MFISSQNIIYKFEITIYFSMCCLMFYTFVIIRGAMFIVFNSWNNNLQA